MSQWGQRPGESDGAFRERKSADEAQSAMAGAGILLIILFAATWLIRIIWRTLDNFLINFIQRRWLRQMVVFVIIMAGGIFAGERFGAHLEKNMQKNREQVAAAKAAKREARYKAAHHHAQRKHLEQQQPEQNKDLPGTVEVAEQSN